MPTLRKNPSQFRILNQGYLIFTKTEIKNLTNYSWLNPTYSGFQIDELHHHNQNLVGTLHKGVPTVVYQHENCCNIQLFFYPDLVLKVEN